jgi:hypothetical protein
VDESFKACDPLLVLACAVAHGRLRSTSFEAFADVSADDLAVGDAEALSFGFDAREQVGVKAAGRRQQATGAGGSLALERVSHAGSP